MYIIILYLSIEMSKLKILNYIKTKKTNII